MFGPSKAAAQLEASKVFCKNLLRNADVPSADYHVFRDAESAQRFVTDRYPDKRPGRAAGGQGRRAGRRQRRGRLLPSRARAARPSSGSPWTASSATPGREIIIEERLDGQEASVLAITDGRTIVTLPPAQDHKPAYDGDSGPNTGGMGAYCPTPLVDEQDAAWIEEHVLVPTVHAMKRSRRPFSGVLYAGLMITNQGPKVLEYNVRFGDPECQPLLMRLHSDLVDMLEATVDRRLDEIAPLEWDPRPAVCVVMAAEGYPGKYETGQPIRGLEEAAELPDVKVFHAGTKLVDGQVLTTGGRVLGVTALGNTISAAKLQAYTAVKCIRWPGAWCRKDISDKALLVEAAGGRREAGAEGSEVGPSSQRATSARPQHEATQLVVIP